MSHFIPVEKWCKDHWPLLGYLETLCVDGKEGTGQIDRHKVRCNAARHPLCAALQVVGWKPGYGTRLQGYFEFANRVDPAASEAAGFQLTQHDDWDCLDDMNAAEFVETLSMTKGLVRLTDKGMEAAAKLREHKARGGMFATFQYGTPALI